MEPRSLALQRAVERTALYSETSVEEADITDLELPVTSQRRGHVVVRICVYDGTCCAQQLAFLHGVDQT